jgi:Zn-dependent protease
MQPTERRPGLRVATVAGVPVYVGGSWALIAVVLVFLYTPLLQARHPSLGPAAYGVALVFALLLLVAVLVHEAAHAVAARSFGLPVVRVVADLWGGHTAFDAQRSRPGSAAVIAVVGPLSNAVLAALGWASAGAAHGVPRTILGGFAVLNAALAGFNLLPGLPLDGGQLVEAAVWKATGSRNTGMVVAGWCGRVVTIGVVLWFVVRPLAEGQGVSLTDVVWMLFIASFLWAGASAAIRSGRTLALVDRVRLDRVLRAAVGTTPAETLGGALARVQPGQWLVTVDAAGRPQGLVEPGAVASVPPALHAATLVSAVDTPQPPGWVVEADPRGDIVPVIVAMQSLETGVVAVTSHGRLVGVVTAQDVNTAVRDASSA